MSVAQEHLLSRATVSSPNVIRLDFRQDGQVLIFAEDSDKFVMQITDAVQACRAYEKRQEFQGQMLELANHLREWCGVRSSQVRAAMITVRDTGLLVIVIQQSPEYDQALSMQLGEMDWEIANDDRFSLLRIETLCLPSASDQAVISFTGSRPTMVVWDGS